VLLPSKYRGFALETRVLEAPRSHSVGAVYDRALFLESRKYARS
jgi:hypothetical protein